ncbi:phage major capsid protein [Pseudactinotalea sp. Z1732]|uniref:phage major capsid protein n=1 Tax=Micrococcales TaxID=85006 RepID=UPI003C7E3614
MPTYNSVISRSDTGGALIPEPVANEIIQETPKSSVILERAQRVPMSSKTLKQPVLTSLPEAYWVNGDTGLKQTTKSDWDNVVMTAEEVAALVPIPDAVVDDTNVPLWDQVRPLLVEAIGKLVDLAAVWGLGKPTSWPTAIVPGAIAAGNTVEAGTGADYGVDVAALAGQVAEDGFAVNGFASRPGLQWRLVGLRSEQGVPIYTPSLSAGAPSGLYGYPLNEVVNGSWQGEVADLIAADWSKFAVGIRQDITFKMLDQAVITDDDGRVIFNAPQQDSQIMRVVMRVGFQIANPLTRIGDGNRYPAGVLTPATTTPEG